MTAVLDKTIADILDDANMNNFDRALAQVKLGRLLSPQKLAVVQLAAATVVLDPPALLVMDATVVDGTAVLGPRHVADDAATPSAPGATGPGIATLSDDGTTLTFEDTVTEVVITYMPRSAVDMSGPFAVTGLD